MSQMPEISYQGMDGEYMLFLIDGERVSGEGATIMLILPVSM